MGRALIFAGGDYSDPSFYKSFVKDDDMIIATDGALDSLEKIGIEAKFLIGDMDSTPEDKLKNFKGEVFKVDKEKDETDTELAVMFAQQEGNKEIKIFGSLANEFDHAHANMRLLLKGNIELIDEKHSVRAVTSKIRIEGKEGDIVSVFAFPAAYGVSTSGLKFPIDGKDIEFHEVKNVRNEMTGNSCEVTVDIGTLLVFHHHSKE